MATRLFVGNIPYSTSEDELRRLFSQVGRVDSVEIPLDRQTGRPRGFGFVQMANDQEAQTAISRFDGFILDGRRIRVNVAQERETRSGAYARRTE
jgi:cold-inducible RNA-binding protein